MGGRSDWWSRFLREGACGLIKDFKTRPGTDAGLGYTALSQRPGAPPPHRGLELGRAVLGPPDLGLPRPTPPREDPVSVHVPERDTR